MLTNSNYKRKRHPSDFTPVTFRKLCGLSDSHNKTTELNRLDSVELVPTSLLSSGDLLRIQNQKITLTANSYQDSAFERPLRNLVSEIKFSGVSLDKHVSIAVDKDDSSTNNSTKLYIALASEVGDIVFAVIQKNVINGAVVDAQCVDLLQSAFDFASPNEKISSVQYHRGMYYHLYYFHRQQK
jgi:hypothetical protein